MQNDHFHYSYNAAQQQEIQAIRDKYTAAPKQEDKLAQLRRLDESATNKAAAWSIAVGVIGALVMGSGMSLAMTDIGAMLGLGTIAAFGVGIVAGLCGIGLICAAYPVYNRVLLRERKRIEPQIIRLSDELLQ